MRENRIRSIWAEGRAVVNGWCAIPSSFSAEIMGGMAWDSVTVDMQHGVIDYQTAVGMFQAICIGEAMPMARVAWNEPSAIMKALDAGAYGIICPMVNNRAEAERFAGAMRYAPRGYRSSGPVRASLWAGDDYMTAADDVVLAFAMVETAEAMGNLDDILSTPEIDAVYIGPSDLSISLGGKPGLDQTDPKVFEAIEAILAAAKRHGKKAGIHTGSVDYARRMVGLGFDLVTLLSDARLLVAKINEVLKDMRADGP